MDRKEMLMFGTLLFLLFVSMIEVTSSFVLGVSPSTAVFGLIPFTTVWNISTLTAILSILYVLTFLGLSLFIFETGRNEFMIWLLPFYIGSFVSMMYNTLDYSFSLYFAPSFVFVLIFVESFYEYLGLVGNYIPLKGGEGIWIKN